MHAGARLRDPQADEPESFEEAACSPYGAIMALDLLRTADLRPGKKVLVVGASSSIGSAAVQLARNHFGAEVTGLCSTAHLDFVRSLGAARAIDYTREDFTRDDPIRPHLRRPRAGVLGAVPRAAQSGWSVPARQLQGPAAVADAVDHPHARQPRRRVRCALAPGSREALCDVRELIEAGALRTVIDRAFPLEQLADAHRYAEGARRGGQVAVVVGG